MGLQRILYVLHLLRTSLSLLLISFFISNGLEAQNTYFGPSEPIPGNPQLVRVQVLVYNSPEQGGLRIQNVEFYGQSIPLKPRDIYGFRGQGTFQVPPGKYKLRWTVERDKMLWPRKISHEEEVTISPRDLWLQITIEGNSASIQ